MLFRSPGAQAGNISVNAAINKVAGVEASLTLNAANAININAPITSNNSVLNLNLNGATANVAATTMVPGTQQGTINLNFGTLDLGSTSTTLANGASLGFARIEGSNAQLNIASNGQATLDVSVLGPGLTVNVPGSSTLVATGGLGLTGSTINLNGNNSTLRLLGAGVQSLYGPGEMSLTGSQGFVVGADTPLNFASESTFITATGPAASLRIGPGVTVRQSSTQGFGRILNISNLSSNEGTLVMEGRNSMTVSGGSWTNTGALRATSGTLNINSSNWSNSGTGLIEAAGGTVNASSTPFTQSGTLKLSSNGQILLPASFTNNGTISGSGTLKLGDGTGALTNQGTIAPGGVGSVGTLRFTG